MEKNLTCSTYKYSVGDDSSLLFQAIQSLASNLHVPNFLLEAFTVKPPRSPALQAMVDKVSEQITESISVSVAPAKRGRKTKDAPGEEDEVLPDVAALTTQVDQLTKLLTAADKSDSLDRQSVDRYMHLCAQVTICLGPLKDSVMPGMQLGLHESQIQLHTLMERLTVTSYKLKVTFRDTITGLFKLMDLVSFTNLTSDSPADFLSLTASLTKLRQQARPVSSLKHIFRTAYLLEYLAEFFPKGSSIARDIESIPLEKDSEEFEEVSRSIFAYSQTVHKLLLNHCKGKPARSPALIAAASVIPAATIRPPTAVSKLQAMTQAQLKDMAVKNADSSTTCPLHPSTAKSHHLSVCCVFLSKYTPLPQAYHSSAFDTMVKSNKDTSLSWISNAPGQRLPWAELKKYLDNL